MEKENFKIVIVGHVDHGKSTFIGRLLYDTDSIPPDKIEVIEAACLDLGKELDFAFITDQIREEREKGITIDTTQIFFYTDKRDYVIIDAPGHKEFMKNMITGASQAEGSVLMVDANEGVREQTRRHAYVLGLLGLKENIILLNKMDLIGYSEARYNEVKKEITDFYASLGIPAKYIIPVSAVLGDNIANRSENMPWYDGPTVLEAVDSLEKKSLEVTPVRYPVQDVYDVEGKKIIAGRIEAGTIHDGDKLMLLPGNKEVTVAGVHEYLHERHSAETGESTGISLVEDVEVKRGNVLSALDSLPRVTTQVGATVFWMCPRPIKVGERIMFRCNTQDMPCKIAKINKRIDSSTSALLEENANALNETEVGEVIIETEQPVVVENFLDVPELGRFVLEWVGIIVAGGVITG
ncbi:MAG TPA: GTP-binding protein [Armatimonadota bacterium]